MYFHHYSKISHIFIQWTLNVLHSHPWQWIAYMFIRLYGFINPITFPLPVQWETTFQCKYLWNSSTVECLSVQTYPFKTTEGELATMICLSLLQALVQNREREKKKPAVFLPVCIQSKCTMSKGGFITSPKKNILPMMKTWLADLGSPGQLLLHCHSNYPWSPVASNLGEKHPRKKGEPQISTKDTFWGERDATWESRAPCPSLGSDVNGYRGPQSETLWDLDVAKSECHIVLPSIRGKTRKSPHT